MSCVARFAILFRPKVTHPPSFFIMLAFFRVWPHPTFSVLFCSFSDHVMLETFSNLPQPFSRARISIISQLHSKCVFRYVAMSTGKIEFVSAFSRVYLLWHRVAVTYLFDLRVGLLTNKYYINFKSNGYRSSVSDFNALSARISLLFATLLQSGILIMSWFSLQAFSCSWKLMPWSFGCFYSLSGLWNEIVLQGYMSIDQLKLKLLGMQGTDIEKRRAKRVDTVLSRHHLLLVTLLLANASGSSCNSCAIYSAMFFAVHRGYLQEICFCL